jgi:hypothetical protein
MDTKLEEAMSRWRSRWILCWGLCGAITLCPLLSEDIPLLRRVYCVVVVQTLIAGWFLLLRFVQNRAVANSPAGEQFRTGSPPKWRLIIYALIAIAIPVYFFAPDVHEHKFWFWFLTILGGGGMVAFFASLPWITARIRTGSQRGSGNDF